MVKSNVKKFPSTKLPPESLMDKINLYPKLPAWVIQVLL